MGIQILSGAESSSREEFLELALSKVNFGWPEDYSATRVGSGWFNFSSTIPDVLINIAQKIESNEQKSRIISIINEELGEGNPDLIHATCFHQACSSVGIEIKPIPLLSITLLMEESKNLENQFSAMGFALGLEIIANENIRILFQSLTSHLNTYSKQLIRESEFFRLHFTNEDEHIDKNIDNFERYVTEEKDFNSFMKGFYKALLFWDQFWTELGSRNG